MKAKLAMGGTNRAPASEVERAALKSLQRGAYMRVQKPKGSEVTSKDVYFAMPAIEGQLTTKNFPGTHFLKSGIDENMPLLGSHVAKPKGTIQRANSGVNTQVLSIKSMLREARD